MIPNRFTSFDGADDLVESTASIFASRAVQMTKDVLAADDSRFCGVLCVEQYVDGRECYVATLSAQNVHANAPIYCMLACVEIYARAVKMSVEKVLHRMLEENAKQ